MSNIAVFLPRSLNVGEMLGAVIFIVLGLGIMLYQGGEKIQRVVDEKSRVKDIPEATLVDLLFAIVLFVFKMASKIPMSTTWCFVGLLAGRELSLSLRKAGDYSQNEQGTSKKTILDAFKMSMKDLVAVIAGFIISLIVGYGANSYFREGVAMTFGGGSDAKK
jgi:phosphate/sulfate permease